MKNLSIAFVALGFLFLTACGSTGDAGKTVAETVAEAPMAEKVPTIVGVAAGNTNFTTLVAAVKAAGLVDVLSGEGPFTVFAPVNDAFAKLPAGTVEGLLKPESKDALVGILTYHVVAGEFKAADVLAAIEKNNGSFTIPTVQKGTLTATLEGGKVMLTDENGNKSTVVTTDVAASNGVIHAIDSVVLPK